MIINRDVAHSLLVADANWRGINSLVGDSGSSGSVEIDNLVLCSGAPPLQQHEAGDLWKCQSCGRVYRLEDALECERCGFFVTAESRFVLR